MGRRRSALAGSDRGCSTLSRKTVRYLLDGRPLQGPSSGRGIGTYERGLISGVAELGDAGDVTLLLANGQERPSAIQDCGVLIASERLPRLHPTLQPVADPVLVARALRRIHPDLYHAVEWGQPMASRCPVVVTVHDLIPFIFPSDYPWVHRSHLLAVRLLRLADRVITPSTATARDVMRFARVRKRDITVIPEGVDTGFKPATTQEVTTVRHRFGLERPFVFAVGTFDPRKRIDVLAAAFARLRSRNDIDLVIAGDQGTFHQHVVTTLRRAGVEEHVRLVGLVPSETLVALYGAATCLLFTSAYEGFGLPPLEAMSCGTPVVMFRNSSLPEVAGPSMLVQPDGDAAALADAAERVMELGHSAEHSAAARDWAARFTWRNAAARTLDVYKEVLRSRASSSH